ncbi:MAG: class I SAM-dependent methyltransferase [Alphaproteobacteria bacterium]|nr:class I SAM-dependent methyltransferase [Alphaproteobacteria bacterium]
MFLAGFLNQLMHTGCLTVIDAKGRGRRFQGSRDGPEVTVRLHSRALHWQLYTNPMLHTGEAYMNGTLTVEDGELYDFLDLVSRNVGWRQPDHWLQKFVTTPLRAAARRLRQYNPAHRARRNVAHHYDLTGELYDLFLDSDRQYSCAYFQSPEDDLETAQLRKKQHLAAKLVLQPGQRVLDIGSGWGGMGLHLAQEEHVLVQGVTLSEEQYKLSNQRVAEAGLNGFVSFALQDYRAVKGTFDRIVSVGMFEHVGLGHYGEFFDKVRDLLTDDGVAVLHTIGRADGPGATNPWINKYIFPGGYSPSLSEIAAAVEKADMYISDVEVFRLQYAETLRHWRRRFQANRNKVAALFDERFCRMWEYYLCGSEVAFRHGGHVVFQVQLTKNADTVPQTRDYIFDEERRRSRRGKKSDSRAA